ncbi:hypothetical protein ACS0TY_017020 [Phlomoides rotata]
MGSTSVEFHAFKQERVFRGERLISTAADPRDRSILRRSTLETSGIVYSYTDKWNHGITVPRDQCDEYGLCGPNDPAQSLCHCLMGFAPKFRKEWDLQGWAGGCSRITPLSCKSGDGFQEVRGVKYPDMLEFWLTTSMSLDECKAECQKSCNCTAYANPYITNGGIGCVIWFVDLIDTRD